MIHWKRLGSLLVCSCCFLGTFVSVSAVKPNQNQHRKVQGLLFLLVPLIVIIVMEDIPMERKI